jgi:hypothetical protein
MLVKSKQGETKRDKVFTGSDPAANKAALTPVRGVKTGFKAALSWLKHSRKIPDDKKAITIAYLENKIKEYGDV